MPCRNTRNPKIIRARLRSSGVNSSGTKDAAVGALADWVIRGFET
jgi:hypothetical protein